MIPETANSPGQTDGTYNRNSDVRYGTCCPGIIELRFKDGKHFIALTGLVVNLSVSGCLFSKDRMPWAKIESHKSLNSLFDVVEESCRIYIPWVNTHCRGKIRRVGHFILGVQFDKPFTESFVKVIAKLEPTTRRRLYPRRAHMYNRILPLMRTTGENRG